MRSNNRKLILGFGLFFLIGCITILVLLRAIYSTPPSTEVVPLSPIPSEQVNTAIAKTAIAASTQTAGVSGTQTSQFYTPTFTLTTTPLGGAPENVKGTPVVSVTPYIYQSPTLFIVPKWTSSATPTKKPKNGYTSDGKKSPALKTQEASTAESSLSDNKKHLGCNLKKTTLTPKQPFALNQNFTVNWLVQNSGADWDHNTVDLVFGTGSIDYKVGLYNLKANIPFAGQTLFSVPMIAPSKAGNYSAIWYLRASKIVFCELDVSITVQ